jgi:putative spermidine/putrescine transport system ATP-binding protein
MAISNDPTLLLCDEPFSGLKGEEREEVLDFLRKVHNKKRITIIVTTQHPQMARLFGEEARMVRLENGRLQEESKPKPKEEEKNDSLSM